MKNLTLPALNVHWLVDPATRADLTAVPATAALRRVDFPIPPKIGHAWLERLPLAEGISLFRGVHLARLFAAIPYHWHAGYAIWPPWVWT